MPKRQEDTSKPSKPLWKLPKSTNSNVTKMREKEGNRQMQGTPRKLSEHSLKSPDQMRTIQNLHVQQRQNCLQVEVSNISSILCGNDLISRTTVVSFGNNWNY